MTWSLLSRLGKWSCSLPGWGTQKKDMGRKKVLSLTLAIMRLNSCLHGTCIHRSSQEIYMYVYKMFNECLVGQCLNSPFPQRCTPMTTFLKTIDLYFYKTDLELYITCFKTFLFSLLSLAFCPSVGLWGRRNQSSSTDIYLPESTELTT